MADLDEAGFAAWLRDHITAESVSETGEGETEITESQGSFSDGECNRGFLCRLAPLNPIYFQPAATAESPKGILAEFQALWSNKAAMLQKLICGTLCVVLLSVASPLPGTATAAGSFKVNGVVIPGTAAASTPIRIGDQFSAGDADVVIRLDEYGAVLILARNSSMTTGEVNGSPFVRLTSGTLKYTLAAASKLLIFKQNEAVKTTALAGVVTIGSHMTPIVIAAGAGTAALVTTVALVRRSPSQP
jgi:hypothetical protein